MYGSYKIGVVILAYNTEKQVRSTIENLPDFVDMIYAINDGSTDKTAEVIRNHKYSRVNLIQHERHGGPGLALSTGYKAALMDDMDIIIKVDGDDQMPLEQIESLIIPIAEGKADYTKGDRLSVPEHRQGMPHLRLFGNLILTWLTRITSGYWQLNDSQNGFTAICKDALQSVNLDLYSYFGYLNDLLVQLNTHHCKIQDVPMPAKYGAEKSSIRLAVYIPKVSFLLMRRFLWRLWRKYLWRTYEQMRS